VEEIALDVDGVRGIGLGEMAGAGIAHDRDEGLRRVDYHEAGRLALTESHLGAIPQPEGKRVLKTLEDLAENRRGDTGARARTKKGGHGVVLSALYTEGAALVNRGSWPAPARRQAGPWVTASS